RERRATLPAHPRSPRVPPEEKETAVTIRIVPVIAIALCTWSLQAQENAAPRGTTASTWAEGTATISYGQPAWRDQFKETVKDGMVWRLGSGDPTSIKLSCGLAATNGAVPPGDYKLALRCASAKEWTLVVYKGNGFYSEGLPSWTIKHAGTVTEDATGAKPLD